MYPSTCGWVYIFQRERERERERERVSSACGGIWVFIIYRRKVSVLFGFIGEKGIHLPVVGYIYFRERERERDMYMYDIGNTNNTTRR